MSGRFTNSRRRAPAYRNWKFTNNLRGNLILCTDEWIERNVDFIRFEKRWSMDRAHRKTHIRQEGVIRFLGPRTENWIVNSLDCPRRNLKLTPLDDDLTVFELNQLFVNFELNEDPTTDSDGENNGAHYDSRSGVIMGFDQNNVRSYMGQPYFRQYQTWVHLPQNGDYDDD